MEKLEPQVQVNPIALNNATLTAMPKNVLRPLYDRASLTPGIVHIGVGNFHRAHQAWYLHRLMQKGEATGWAIIGGSVRAQDISLRAKLQAQDHLTSLIELDPDRSNVEVVGSMIDYASIETNNEDLIGKMAHSAIRIVSLTVTEGGYFIDQATKGFDHEHPDIQHDAMYPEQPRTVFGAMVEALRQRRENGAGPFTCMSCDNIVGNGRVLRQALVSLARLSRPELAEWIDVNCSFPNSMVDCIVPATGPTELELARNLGIADEAPVTHESFRQWVVEDDFCMGRPAWDKVGVTFSDQVHEYEAMKIRILNGGHQVLAVPAQVLGIDTISEAMGHDVLARFFNKVAQTEIAPHVASVPNVTANAYVNLITERFRNPKIIDTTRRVAFDGSSRHPGFVIPSIRDAIKAGVDVRGLALVEASWARMCVGVREDGTSIAPNDPNWAELKECAISAKSKPMVWLQMQHLYGDLVHDTDFAEKFSASLSLIWEEGLEHALREYVES